MVSDNIRIDSAHCRAICDEIGERLRIMLDREATGLPVRLQLLLAQLAAQDLAMASSIVADIDEAVRQREHAPAAPRLVQAA